MIGSTICSCARTSTNNDRSGFGGRMISLMSGGVDPMRWAAVVGDARRNRFRPARMLVRERGGFFIDLYLT